MPQDQGQQGPASGAASSGAPTGRVRRKRADPVQLALDTSVGRLLVPVMASLAALFLLFAVMDRATMAPGVGEQVAMLDVAAAVVFAVGAAACAARRPPPAMAQRIMAGVGVVVVAFGLLVFRVRPAPEETMTYVLLSLGASVVFLSTRWFALVVLSVVGAWLYVVSRVPIDGEWVQFGQILLTSIVLSVVVHQVRLQVHRRMERLALERRRDVSLLEATLESTADGILVVDREGRFTTYNQRFVDMWRIPKEVVESGDDGQAIASVLSQLQDPDRFVAKVQELYERPEAESFDVIPFSDGRVFERYSKPQRVEGRVIGRVWSFRDVTEGRRAQAAVRESEEKWRSLVQSVPETIVTVGPDGAVLFINGGFGGTTAKALVGTQATDLAPEAQRPTVRRAIQRVFAEGATVFYHMTARGSPGTEYRCSAAPIRRDGNTVAALLVATDITDLRQAEAERLQGLARAKELERLREINSFKTRFINTAAHELATPLTPIQLQLHMLRREMDALDPVKRRSIEVIARNMDRLARLVEDMLEAARLQSGKLETRVEPTPLDDVVHEAVDTFQEAAKAQEVRLVVESAKDVAVLVDRQRLAQVLVNLVSNALKFTPAGGTIRVHATAHPQAGTAQVCVRDSGAGLTETQIAKLFQPFSQVHDTMEMSKAGTGLGLFISKGIIEAQGGTIWCESAGPGCGSSFAFTVPLALAETASGGPSGNGPRSAKA